MATDPPNWQTWVDQTDNSRDFVAVEMKGTRAIMKGKNNCDAHSQVFLTINRGDDQGQIQLSMTKVSEKYFCVVHSM